MIRSKEKAKAALGKLHGYYGAEKKKKKTE